MMKHEQSVNLARKLRPKTFRDIIGQSLSVKILQNSLYLKKYFPVYLFSGQRGCGKTTSARVFATAVNCLQLPLFQGNPSEHPMPCLTCFSCQAMARGEHPDFIEIDAASHTGVDHVRHIIESATYVPLLGQKKVYLIDEAHMLSKAAFNAFLKILEEPPQTVLFMLATTERHKVPETVLSRCFQLNFPALDRHELLVYLTNVCDAEGMSVNSEALSLIIEETDGSVRDALNVLEQVRFSQTTVTQETIVTLLGKVSNQSIIKLVTLIIEHNAHELLLYMKQVITAGSSAQVLWELIVELLRALLWVKNGVDELPPQFSRYDEAIKSMATAIDHRRLYAMLTVLWELELIFLQTAHKHIFLEMLLLQLCSENTSGSGGKLQAVSSTLKTMPSISSVSSTSRERDKHVGSTSFQEQKHTKQSQEESPWLKAVEKIAVVSQDAFLDAILKQAKVASYNKQTGITVLQLSNNGDFFKDKVLESVPLCKPILEEYYPGFQGFEIKALQSDVSSQDKKEFSNVSQSSAVNLVTKKTPAAHLSHGGSSVSQKRSENVEKQTSPGMRTLTVEDKEQWPDAHTVLTHVPGVIKIEE